MSAEVSHGRGGAGNINTDKTEYVDGEIVRAGPEGSRGDGAYSAGRGGAGNISDVGTAATKRKDQDVFSEAAVRPSQDTQDYHTGRGGAGNEVVNGKEKEKENENESTAKKVATSAPVGLADRLKNKLMGAFKK